MIVVEINEGKKIEYEVTNTKITFADELMLNLAKYQNENDVKIDICMDTLGNLTNKVTANGRYVAQIIVPGFEYEKQETNEQIATVSEDDSQSQNEEVVRLPLNMGKVQLSLWSLD